MISRLLSMSAVSLGRELELSSGKRKIPRLLVPKGTDSTKQPSSSALPAGPSTQPFGSPTTPVAQKSRVTFAPCSATSGLTHLPRALSSKRPSSYTPGSSYSFTSMAEKVQFVRDSADDHKAESGSQVVANDDQEQGEQSQDGMVAEDVHNTIEADDDDDVIMQSPGKKPKKVLSGVTTTCCPSTTTSARKDAPPIYSNVRATRLSRWRLPEIRRPGRKRPAEDPKAQSRSQDVANEDEEQGETISGWDGR